MCVWREAEIRKPERAASCPARAQSRATQCLLVSAPSLLLSVSPGGRRHIFTVVFPLKPDNPGSCLKMGLLCSAPKQKPFWKTRGMGHLADFLWHQLLRILSHNSYIRSGVVLIPPCLGFLPLTICEQKCLCPWCQVREDLPGGGDHTK